MSTIDVVLQDQKNGITLEFYFCIAKIGYIAQVAYFAKIANIIGTMCNIGYLCNIAYFFILQEIVLFLHNKGCFICISGYFCKPGYTCISLTTNFAQITLFAQIAYLIGYPCKSFLIPCQLKFSRALNGTIYHSNKNHTFCRHKTTTLHLAAPRSGPSN